MTRFCILYFSGTGNTEWVVKRLQEELKMTGGSVEILAADQLRREGAEGKDAALLEQRLSAFVSPADCLILAYPVYASDIPRPLKELLPLLPPGNGRKLAVVTTAAMTGGDCVLLPARILKKKDYRLLLANEIKMPNNLRVPLFAFAAILNGEALNPYYERADKAVKKIAELLWNEKTSIRGKGPFNHAMGIAQRIGMRMVGPFLVTKRLFADEDCVRCGLCVSSCPMENIRFDESNRPRFGADCCYCLRCYNACPTSAIQVTARTKDEKRYPRYRGPQGWRPPRLRVSAENKKTP